MGKASKGLEGASTFLVDRIPWISHHPRELTISQKIQEHPRLIGDDGMIRESGLETAVAPWCLLGDNKRKDGQWTVLSAPSR